MISPWLNHLKNEGDSKLYFIAWYILIFLAIFPLDLSGSSSPLTTRANPLQVQIFILNWKIKIFIELSSNHIIVESSWCSSTCWSGSISIHDATISIHTINILLSITTTFFVFPSSTNYSKNRSRKETKSQDNASLQCLWQNI